MKGRISILVLVAVGAIFLAGCATKATPIESEAVTPASEPQPTAPVAASRTAVTAPEVVKKATSNRASASCIDGINRLGPVRLGMTPEEVRRVAPWLKIDDHWSEMLSIKWATICGERVRNYKVRFDADCRVRVVWFTGPARLERLFKNICSARSTPEPGVRKSIKWTCAMNGSLFSVLPQNEYENIYRLFRYEEPEGFGRCMMPDHWD